jgi:hypothetical protein
MMEREQPKVPLAGKLAELVMSCLRVVDPYIETKALEGTTGVFPALWNRCVAGLKQKK